MGTPFITHLEPSPLTSYDHTKPPDAQVSQNIPKTFLEAMTVRESVFVQEQGVPLEHEFDADDARSCHWVIYASVNETTTPEVRDPNTGEVIQRRRSSTRSQPIGTIRLVPFPHPPHPKAGAKYINGKLQTPQGPETDGAGERVGPKAPSWPPVEGATQAETEERRHSAPLPFGTDRATSFHDGKEAYVKLGRLAVVKEFRGHRIAGMLVRAALGWIKANPTYFDPSVKELGLEQLQVGGSADEIPKFNGLICVHAQEGAVKVWERYGFQVDEGMGKWEEEKIIKVGMFARVEVKQQQPQIR